MKPSSKKPKKLAVVPIRPLAQPLPVGESKNLRDEDRPGLNAVNNKLLTLRETLGKLTYQSLQIDIQMRQTADQITAAQSEIVTLSKAAIAAVGEDPENNQWNVDFGSHTVTRTK
jgi:hypothetical protein